MNNVIKNEVERRGITRICHFTPSRNLVHILTGKTGILATKNLQNDERNLYTQTDLNRLDRHEKFICSSIEYPNVWYFDKAKSKDILFKDWVVLLISPKYLWMQGTRFCQRNAAANYGKGIGEGEQAFFSMFASTVPGSQGKIFPRESTHLLCCPTDNQAEVLIPDQIGISDILAIAVPTETQAKNEIVRLEMLGEPSDKFKFIIAPKLFDKNGLSKSIRSGKRPKETPWN